MTDHSDRAEARRNTLVVAAVLACLAAWNIYRHRPLRAEALVGMALTLILMALCLPSWAARFNRTWMALAEAFGYVNSRILLTLFYYLILTPLGAILRLMRHDPLRRRGPERDTYWIPRQSPRQQRDGFERSF